MFDDVKSELNFSETYSVKGVDLAKHIKSINIKYENDIKGKQEQVKVFTRFAFERIIEIDTKLEKYDADVVIESSWFNDNVFKTLISTTFNKNSELTKEAENEKAVDINLKNLLKNIENFNYKSSYFWSPQLYIANAINTKEEIRYKLRIVPKHHRLFKDPNFPIELNSPSAFVDNLTVLVTEVRKVRGIFYERLELNEFPIDLQELSVTMSSQRSSDEVLIVEDRSKDTYINKNKFYELQSWLPFPFCKTEDTLVHDELRGFTRSQLRGVSYVIRKSRFYIYK